MRTSCLPAQHLTICWSYQYNIIITYIITYDHISSYDIITYNIIIITYYHHIAYCHLWPSISFSHRSQIAAAGNLPGNWNLLPQALQQLAGATPMSRLQELREKMLVGPMGPMGLLCCLQGLGGFMWKNMFFFPFKLFYSYQR